MFEYWVTTCLNDISILSGILITFTMAEHMKNDHIGCCQLDAHIQWVECRAISLFLTIWSSNVGSILFPHSLTQMGHMFILLRSYPRGWVRCMRVSSVITSWLSYIILMLHDLLLLPLILFLKCKSLLIIATLPMMHEVLIKHS